MSIGTFRSEKSLNGLSLDVLKSALQKYIRRGMFEKAAFVAGELDLFKDADCRQEAIRSNFLHRLMVIFLEDVGDLSIWESIDSKLIDLLNERTKQDRNKEKEERLLCEMVCEMCNAKKSRLPSHVRSLFGNVDKYIEMAESYYPSLKVHSDAIKNALRVCTGDVSIVASGSVNNTATTGSPPTFAELCSRFRKALKQRDLMSVFWAFKISQSDFKLSGRKKKPVYKIFEILQEYCGGNDQWNNLLRIALRWFEELKTIKECFLPWINIILLVVGAKQCVDNAPPVASSQLAVQNWNRNRECRQDKQLLIELDDFVYDIHTSGRSRRTANATTKMNSINFALEGAIVIPENACEVQPLLKQFYEDTKRVDCGVQPIGECVKAFKQAGESTQSLAVIKEVQKDDKVNNSDNAPIAVCSTNSTKSAINVINAARPADVNTSTAVMRETEAFQFIVRTQLTTSNGKTDVYIAKKDGKLYVVKGPIPDTAADIHLQATEWKKSNGLPYIPSYKIKMLPDRWLEGVPLGLRNKLDRTKPATFLIIDSLVEERDLVFKNHSSKLWPETQIVDWKQVKTIRHMDIKTANDNVLKQYIEALCFRYVWGINDAADRNFIIANGVVYSIDENSASNNVIFWDDLKKNKCLKISEWIKVNYDRLDVHNWHFNSTEHAERYKAIINKDRLLDLFKEQ